MKKIIVFAIVVFFAATARVQADPKQIKVYKEAFPDESPKCIMCHASKMPKKDDGQHELNDYGKKVKAENAEPTAETYTKVGKAPAAE